MANDGQAWGKFWAFLGAQRGGRRKRRLPSHTVNIPLTTLSPHRDEDRTMDIWSRLLGGATGSSAKQRADLNSPQQRLIRFKKAHDQLQHIWRRNTASASVTVPPEPVYSCLQNLTTILRDEVQTPTPHLCARHVSTFHIHTVLAQVSATYNDEGIVHQTIEIFKILLDSEEGDFLKDKTFADALIGYVSTLSMAGLNADTEARMVELLFAIAAKLRLQPEILSTWFRPSSGGLEDSIDFAQGKTSPKEDFPLFYLTVAYIHHDGRVGDFARTGLLYLIESAGQSAALEQWIIESDLATLMASGLGALYSQLSRKLVLSFDEGALPAIISFSESPSTNGPSDAEKTTSLDFKSHLTTFLSHLVFWQDVLEHCTSAEVKHSLLDHFKFLFLQQLLYPSLIESSDLDGGSSVAVLTYLRCIIESIDHPDLIGIVFQYLLAVPEAQKEEIKPSRPTALARRRKSENLISNLAQGQEKPVPDLFNLIDLVLSSLRSRNQQTVTATLRLVSVLLRNRHKYNFSLIKTRPAEDGQPSRSLAAHDRDVATLFSIVEDLAGSDSLREAYETQLQDVQNALESHECSALLLPIPGSSSDVVKTVRLLSIQPDDPFFSAVVDLLMGFMASDIETNLALTQAISTLANCGSLQLDGWLVGAPRLIYTLSRVNTFSKHATTHLQAGDAKDENDRVDEDDIQAPPKVCEPASSEKGEDCEKKEDLSPVFAALESLLQQVEGFRREIQNFDIYLSECKHVFKVGEDIDNAATSEYPLARKSEEDSALMPPPPKPRPQIGSINERLLSTDNSTQGSRASSPRGRQAQIAPDTTLAGRLSHLRVSPSPKPIRSNARAFSPSPSSLREDSISSTPPRRVATPMGPADALKQKVKVRLPFEGIHRKGRDFSGSSETSSIRSESTAPEPREHSGYKEVSLSHVLTNVIILQEFVLELAAIVQVRASLFGEVQF